LPEKGAAMSFLRKKRVFALLFITFLLFLFANSNMLGKWMYPVRYQQHIDASSQTYGVDRFLIASIIRVESNFRPDRTSPKGAVGLMQIMPDTAEWIMELDDVPPPRRLIWTIRGIISLLERDISNGSCSSTTATSSRRSPPIMRGRAM